MNYTKVLMNRRWAFKMAAIYKMAALYNFLHCISKVWIDWFESFWSQNVLNQKLIKVIIKFHCQTFKMATSLQNGRLIQSFTSNISSFNKQIWIILVSKCSKIKIGLILIKNPILYALKEGRHFQNGRPFIYYIEYCNFQYEYFSHVCS
jgi:hypothetical protein